MFAQIKSKINAVEHYSKFIELCQQGRVLKGLCPFHQEDTPSFTVFSGDGGWYCFGQCQTGGSVIDFEIHRQKLTAIEAAKWICDNYNIPVATHDWTGFFNSEKKRKEKEGILGVIVKTLKGKQSSIEYLKSRGLTEETVQRFQVGCGSKNDVIVIPIHDHYGRVAAFAQRFIQTMNGHPKYINDSTDEIYKKDSILFNFHDARKYVDKLRYFIFNEGYFDVMTWWQCGYPSAVAYCSATITKEQIASLKDFLGLNTTVYFVVTNDKAAHSNFFKNRLTFRMFFPEVHTRVIVPPGQVKDINDILIHYGSDAVKDCFINSVPSDVFLVKQILGSEPIIEKQYVMTREVIKQAENLLVIEDIISILAQAWNKDRETIRQFFGSKSTVDIGRLKTIDKMVEDYEEYTLNIDKNKISLGWPRLDKMFRGGIRIGDVLQIVSAAGVGKTTFAENIISNILGKYQDVPVVFFSLEQIATMAFERWMMMEGTLTGEQVEKWLMNPSQEERNKVSETIQKISKKFKNLVVVDEPNMSLSSVEEYCAQSGMHIFQTKPKVIVIDYLGFLSGTGNSVYEIVSFLAKQQKQIAKKGYALISLHQVSRKGGTGGEPIEADSIRDSGVVFESADEVISMWRPELGAKITEAEKRHWSGICRFKILKNRYGVANEIIDYYFQPQYAQFFEKSENAEVGKDGTIKTGSD